ncbi:hypothetical protein MPLDJ20_180057 [Mesorhizobium plurifarium]|uniref:Uncharacterized protein n=1 Tax=Mesorhizobium plurifarium TaxID=69974 RepID=A0A090GJT6_MESPL|nr:hypothetical protein MPLDJ20_180057 [Mesorhizobium plurifarium]
MPPTLLQQGSLPFPPEGGRWRCEAATDWGNHVAIKPRPDQARQSQKMCAWERGGSAKRPERGTPYAI